MLVTVVVLVPYQCRLFFESASFQWDTPPTPTACLHSPTCVASPSQECVKMLVCVGGGHIVYKYPPGGSSCLVLSHDQTTAVMMLMTRGDSSAVLPPDRIHQTLNGDFQEVTYKVGGMINLYHTILCCTLS